MSNTLYNYQLAATSSYTILPPLSKGSASLDSPSRPPESTTKTVIFSSKTTSAEIPAIRINENLSPEDKDAREKGFQLVARMEHLAQTDEGFRRWLQVGIDQIESGEFVTFSENGWEE